MSNPAKFIRNSMLHRALDTLSHSPLNEFDLKRSIGFSASMPRFNQHITIPLTNNHMVKRRETLYHITPAGEEALQTLGRLKIRMASTSKFVPTGSYDGHELKMAAVRQGADNHMKLPSRVGDSLFYRDGRVEVV
jgi:hypothetical protein